jgi:hypothetical protein
MSLMKAKLERLQDQEERFRYEVERDSYRGRVLLECAEELAGYYTGTKFVTPDDNGQWQIESNRD